MMNMINRMSSNLLYGSACHHLGGFPRAHRTYSLGRSVGSVRLLWTSAMRYSSNLGDIKLTPYELDNLLLLDVSHNHLLAEISGTLRQKYLSPFYNDSKQAKGVIYGPHARPLVCLPVKSLQENQQWLGVHFLVDTGAPITYLSKQALKAIFGVEDLALSHSKGVNIWGVNLSTSLSDAHHSDINVLGGDYLRRANISLQLQYNLDPRKEYFKIVKKS